MPLVSARASVWQAPHLATNCCLPTITFAFSPCLAEQPAAVRTSASSSAAGRDRPADVARAPARQAAHIPRDVDPRHQRGNSIRTSGRQGSDERVQLTARRGDHAPGDALPRPALAHGPHETGAGLLAYRGIGRQPGHDPLGERRDRGVVHREGQPRGDLGGHGARERGRDLRETGVGGADRQRPAGGGLGGDHAERLGERARHDQRLARGQQIRQLVVIQAAGEHDAVGQDARGVAGNGRERLPAGRAETPADAGSAMPSAASRSPPPAARADAPAARGRRRTRRPRAWRRARSGARAARTRAAGRRPC